MITRETADPCPDFAPLLIAAVLLWSAGLGAAHDDGPGGRGEGSVTAEGSTAPSPVLATGQRATIATGESGNVVRDHLTGLVWTQDASLLVDATWDNALAAIQAMNAGGGIFGFTDWRLPNARELRSLVDYSQFNPPLVPSHPFLDVQSVPYWSSTTFAGNLNLAGVVSMEQTSGLRSFELKGSQFGVWAVRSTAESDLVRVGLFPAGMDFGDVAIGVTEFRVLTVQNTGTGSLQPGAITVGGVHAGDFSIGMNDCAGAQLGSGQSCAIAIGFTPSAPGIRRTTLLESNALTSPDPADLIGTSGVLFFDGFELG